MTHRLLFALNAVLLLAVGFLFYKVYQQPEPAAAAPVAISAPAEINDADTAQAPVAVLAQGSGAGIYYVNTDTLLAKYGVFKTQKAQLEARSQRLEAELQRRATALQQEVAEATQKMQNGQLTQTQAQEADSRLRQRGAELEQYRDEQTSRLMADERAQTEKLNKRIQDFLKGFAGRRGYKYVLGYTTGGGILYANDSLDITAAVVAGLNKK